MSFKEQHEKYVRPKQITGIYKISNLYNNKVYIGKSIDIPRRFSEHRSSYEWSRTPNKPLYKAFKKYGVESFSFEVIEKCTKEQLNDREKYWIKYYDSTNPEKGYNITEGGDGHSPDEQHPNHRLTKQDVIDIRTRYANHERKMDVEKDYLDKIGPSGFRKIWQGLTWSDIMPEVYTLENKEFHKNNTGLKGEKNGRALLSEQNVYDIRMRKKNGESWESVYQDYKYTGIKKASFQQTWYGRNWKHIIVE